MLQQPDIVVGLRPNAFAPVVARRVLAHVGRPSTDLCDAVDVIVSNLVTRACAQRPAASERIGLRAWQQRTVVRVEVEVANGSPGATPSGARWSDPDIELLEGFADRWGIEHLAQASTVVWFEIDRVS